MRRVQRINKKSSTTYQLCAKFVSQLPKILIRFSGPLNNFLKNFLWFKSRFSLKKSGVETYHGGSRIFRGYFQKICQTLCRLFLGLTISFSELFQIFLKTLFCQFFCAAAKIFEKQAKATILRICALSILPSFI